ncbi:MAG: HNH endonuclease signature motif containing protein [Dehalococcoidales bacterium]|nr:HNH endonuclease signature motif containing protein [Dehalococcoidales bacterium]
MPRRMTVRQHETLYKFIVARDGEQCLICRRKPLPGEPLEIDHADSDPENWDPDNLHLLCKDDNLDLRGFTSAEHKLLIEQCSALIVCERFKEHGLSATSIVKDFVNYRSGSLEMQANSYFEIAYRDWILTEVKRLGFMYEVDAIDGGAEEFGSSPETTKRYLRKLTSYRGPLEVAKDAIGNRIIRFRK